MLLIWILAIIDLHTLFVLLAFNYLPDMYVFSGSSFAMLKGLVFFIPSQDIFSFLDILTGFLMLFLLLGGMWSVLWWSLFVYLIYKLIMSFLII